VLQPTAPPSAPVYGGIGVIKKKTKTRYIVTSYRKYLGDKDEHKIELRSVLIEEMFERLKEHKDELRIQGERGSVSATKKNTNRRCILSKWKKCERNKLLSGD
jgi:hypothetical protein